MKIYRKRTNGTSRGNISTENSLNGVNSGLNIAEEKIEPNGSNRNYLKWIKWIIEKETGRKKMSFGTIRGSLTCNCKSQGVYTVKISEDTSVAEKFSKFDANYKPRDLRSSTWAE